LQLNRFKYKKILVLAKKLLEKVSSKRSGYRYILYATKFGGGEKAK